MFLESNTTTSETRYSTDTVLIFLEFWNGRSILKLAFQRFLEDRDILEDMHLYLYIIEILEF